MHIIHDEIGTPQIKILKADDNCTKVVISPLPPGYGITLGNSMRRVLLSSLPGTSVVAMKIPGVTHEYTTIKGLKDSVFDITLNLRELKLKKHSKGAEIVELPFVKTGKLTAKDLKVSSDIEILDPSQIITTCDGADSRKKAQIFIEKGVGYRLISNEDSFQVEDPEKILIDANFSPIVSVSYDVTSARVGENTNLDKLTMTVKNDGSLDSEKAIKLAASILQSYFELFNKENAYTDEDYTTSFDLLKQKKESEEKAASEAKDQSFTPIDILGLSQRTLNALVNGDITSVEELLQTPMSQLSQLRGFGQKAKTELDHVLVDKGYIQGVVDKIKSVNKLEK